MERIARSLFDEVNDAEMVERILRRLDEVAVDCERDLRAGEAARPDVHSRRRRRTQGILTRDGANNSKRNATPICTSGSSSEAGIPDKCERVDRQNARIMSPNVGTPAEPTECKLSPRQELRATSREERKQNAKFLEPHTLLSAVVDRRADKTRPASRRLPTE
jgi:hypothetical protein